MNCPREILFEKDKITRQSKWIALLDSATYFWNYWKGNATALSMLNFSGPLIYLALCHGEFVTCWSHSFRSWRELNWIRCANDVSSASGIYISIEIKWSSSCFRRTLPARAVLNKNMQRFWQFEEDSE